MTREQDIRNKYRQLEISEIKINETIEWLRNHEECGEEWLLEEIKTAPNKAFNRNCSEKPSQSG